MNLLPRKALAKQVLNMALPAIAGLSSQMIVSLVDTAMVGRLENAKYSLAAMGLGVLATWAVISFFSSLSSGTHILIARREGEKDYHGCKLVLNNSLMLSFIIGLFFGILIYIGAPHFAYLIAKDPEVEHLAGTYISIRFLSLPFFLMTVSYRGFFFGIGHTKIFMISGLLLNIVNIFLCWVLIYGNLGAPKLGLAGSAWAAASATAVDFFFYLTVTFLHYYRKKYRSMKFFKIDFKIIKSIVRLSLPVSLQNIFILVGFLSFVAIVGIIGTLEQAATQTVISAIFISLLPCFGFGIAAQTLVGNNLGLKKFRFAEAIGIETIKLTTIFTLSVAFIFILFPELILKLITNDKLIIDTAIIPLRIAGFSQIFYGIAIVLAYSLQAAGQTLYVMFAEVLTNWIVFIPLAYLLGTVLNFGFIGAWFSLPVYILIYMLLVLVKFKLGSWKTVKI